jgi:hypothetical protein
MKEYIERAAVLKVLEEYYPGVDERLHIVKDITSIPTAAVAEVRHGKIIETIKDGKMNRVFSCYGHDFTELTCWYMPKYCPNCGARMDKEDEHGSEFD